MQGKNNGGESNQFTQHSTFYIISSSVCTNVFLLLSIKKNENKLKYKIDPILNNYEIFYYLRL